MPKQYQKRSQSQKRSKNGGLRRKQTLKQMRRRKSRKVMRGRDDAIAGKIQSLSDDAKAKIMIILGVKNPYAVKRENLPELNDAQKTELKNLGFDVALFP